MATSSVPTPLSYQSILGQQLNTLRSRLGLQKFRPGGPLLTIHEASSQVDARNAADIFTALQTQDLDNAVGQVLDRIGADEDLPRRPPKASIGFVTITDTAFQKLSSTLYHGLPAPIIGSVTIYVTKGNTFDTAPSTGQVYLGRGTQDYEGPLNYTAKVNSGTFWTLTISPTTKFHNQGESVILAQGGDRPIQVNQIASTAQGASTAPITFTVSQAADIPDGETFADSIPITCTVDGIAGNVPAGSVVSFGASLPFSTATVINPLPIQYGRDIETDNDYRDRIRQNRANKQRGTDQAIKNAVIDISSPDEASSVLSANVVRHTNRPTVLYIDDGNGYEEKTAGVGYESVIDSATGGETDLATVFSPIAQASVTSANFAPWTIPDGASLTIRVGGVSSTHYFNQDQFTSPLAASAYDVVSAINSNPNLLFQARVTSSGETVTFYSRSETNDDIQVVLAPDPTSDAAVILGLSTTHVYTTSLYLNDILLSKDGALAEVTSNPFLTWAPLAGPQTIEINVDFTGNYTYTIADIDFQNLGYSLLSNATTAVWATVLTNKLPGITATAENDTIILTSNKGRSSSAYVSVVGGSLVSSGMFGIVNSQGISFDYSLDRAVGSIVLNNPLAQYDKLTLGTEWAAAFVQTTLGGDVVNVSANSKYSLVVDDINATIIPTGMFTGGNYTASVYISDPNYTSFLVSNVAGYVPVPGIEAGDWVLLNDSAFTAPWPGIYRNEGGQPNGIEITQKADGATRIGHTVTALEAGENLVFVAGGCTSVQDGIGLPGALKGRGVTGNCQSYNYSTGAWTQLLNLLTPRAYHTATLLPNGNVLIAGGFNAVGVPLSSTEIYNPTANTITSGPNMSYTRAHHTATLMPTGSSGGNGNVLIAGGYGNTGSSSPIVLNTAEIYNTSNNTFATTTNMNTARYGHHAVWSNTTVVALGGISIVPTVGNNATPISAVEAYAWSVPSWTNGASMTSPRAFFGATNIISTPNILIVAGNCARLGWDNTGTYTLVGLGTSQVYTPSTNTWASEVQMNTSLTSGTTVQFIQNSLVTSYTSGNIIAGYVNCISSGGNSFLSPLQYNTTTNVWSDLPGTSTGFYSINNIINNREAAKGVALTGSGQDSIAWFGGSTSTHVVESLRGISNVDILNTSTSTWSHPFPVFSDLALANGKLFVVRSKYAPDVVTIPTGVYTADTFVSAFNSSAVDTVAQKYQTTRVRVSTLSDDGALLVVDQDQQNGLPIFPTDITVSQLSQYPSIYSASGVGTPQGFQIRTVGSTTTNATGLPQTIQVPDYSNYLNLPIPLDPNGTVVGLNLYSSGGASNSYNIPGPCGNVKGVRGVIGSYSSPGTTTESFSDTNPALDNIVGLRQSIPVFPGNPVCVMNPFKFDVNDTLVVTIDGNTDTQRFVIPMARKCGTNGSYQNPLSLNDANNSNATLSTAFGTSYNFNDFAIVSRARVITSPSDSTRTVLWRWYQYGETGNNAALRYVYPTAPNQSIGVTCNSVQQAYPVDQSYYQGYPKATVDINIGSGALRQNRNTSPNTRYGISRGSTTGSTTNIYTTYIFTGFTVTSGSRPGTNGTTTLVITVPYTAGVITGPGLNAGDVVWYNSSTASSSTLQNGQFQIQTVSGGVGTWSITIAPDVLNDGTIWSGSGANLGTISTDPTQKAAFDSSVVVGDFVSINSSTGVVTTDTMQIRAIDTVNRQWIQCNTVNFANVPALTSPLYSTLPTATDIQIFAAANNTASTIVAAVNAIPNTPITGVATGSGSGIIDTADWDNSSTNTDGTADFRYLLSDGINYVASTNNPANTTLPTTFNLKIPVNGALTTDNDFANEVFYLVPQLTQSVVQWLNTPCITGLWSVASVTTSENNTKVQISSNTPGRVGSVLVESGLANSATAAVIGTATLSNFNYDIDSGMVLTVSQSEAQSLCGSSWAAINNTFPMIKNNNVQWGGGNSLTSITAGGVFTFTNAPYQVQPLTAYTGGTALVSFEKIGNYVAISLDKTCNPVPTISYAVSGAWVWIGNPAEGTVPPSNCGYYKILRFSQTETSWTYWINNPNVIEVQNQIANVSNIPELSPIPGDILSINSNLFGGANIGQYKIIDIGGGYSGALTITVALPNGTTLIPFTGPTAQTLTSDISIIEGTPNTGAKRVLAISPNPINPSDTDILLDDVGSDSSLYLWQQSAGTIITALDKLNFSNNVVLGTDAYDYDTGLIAEAKRVIYGDSADVDNYSGYVAEGAQIVIQGPTVKRIQLTLQVRLQTNAPSADTIGAIQSAAASIINASTIGTPIAISEIIDAVQNVNGVLAVSVVTPNYSPVNDQIPLSGQEKAMIVDLDTDITVLVVGN